MAVENFISRNRNGKEKGLGNTTVVHHISSSHFLLMISCLIFFMAFPLLGPVPVEGGKTKTTTKLVKMTTTTPTPSTTITPNNNSVNGSEGSACRKLIMILAKRLMKHLKPCNEGLRKLYPTNEAFSEHFQCTVKCFLQNVKMTDENHQLTNETYVEFVKGQIPEKYQALSFRLQAKCIQIYGYKLDAKDEYCKSYGDYLKCVQEEISGKC